MDLIWQYTGFNINNLTAYEKLHLNTRFPMKNSAEKEMWSISSEIWTVHALCCWVIWLRQNGLCNNDWSLHCIPCFFFMKIQIRLSLSGSNDYSAVLQYLNCEFESHQCLQVLVQVHETKGLATMLAEKTAGGVMPEVNLKTLLLAMTKDASKRYNLRTNIITRPGHRYEWP